jgi:high mobility group protein 20A
MFVLVREAELRQLRKQNTEYEEQNAVLSKHVENMKQAIDKLELEAVQQRKNNEALQKHLSVLRSALVANFSRLPLPGKGIHCHHQEIVILLSIP